MSQGVRMQSFDKCPYDIVGPLTTSALLRWAVDNDKRDELADAVKNHLRGNWGEVSDPQANTDALVTGGQLLSVWTIADKKVWVISDPPRGGGARVVTALFPDEY